MCTRFYKAIRHAAILAAPAAAILLLAACAAPAPQVVEKVVTQVVTAETAIVTVQETEKVVEKVVLPPTDTPVPLSREAVTAQLIEIPGMQDAAALGTAVSAAYAKADIALAATEQASLQPPSEVILVATAPIIADLISSVVAKSPAGSRQLTLLDGRGGDAGSVCKGCVLRVYSAGGSKNDPYTVVGEVVAEAYQRKDEIYADPNYLIQTIQSQSSQGTLFSPWYIEPSPFGGAQVATLKAFTDSWALPSIGLPAKEALLAETAPTGVPIYVFDTSPFASGSHTIAPSQSATVLTVKSPYGVAQQATGGGCTAANHGFFVTSLIHQVAPNRPITLYPVLNGCGMGTLDGLLKATLDVGNPLSNEPKPVVLNYSLGVVYDPVRYGLPAGDKDLNKQVSLVPSLFMALLNIRLNGGTIVAAAGNDSAGLSSPAYMQRPAAYPFVIGVAASNDKDKISCYSNQGKLWDGWVMAPGGDGRTPDSQEECKPRTKDCGPEKNGGQCAYGVVGRVDWNTDGFAYWVGTSFAAPWVSGLAAECLNQVGPGKPQEWLTALWKPGPVWEAIGQAGLVNQVIDVPEILAYCKNAGSK